MLVTEEEVCDWTRTFCIALENHDGRHSLLDYLQQARQQQGNAEFCAVLDSVRDNVGQGYALSHALSQHPEVFREPYVTTVRYGEIYGELEVTLRRYIDRPEDRAALCHVPPLPDA